MQKQRKLEGKGKKKGGRPTLRQPPKSRFAEMSLGISGAEPISRRAYGSRKLAMSEWCFGARLWNTVSCSKGHGVSGGAICQSG